MPTNDPKLEALREQGTLNPRPGEVTDPRFAKDSFFDPRDLVQVKYEMLRRVQSEGHSITGAATAFGFSRPSFYQAQSAFAEGGLAGLVPHKRGPKQAHKLTDQVLAYILSTRQQEPSVRTTELVGLIQERFGRKLHPRSIERSLKRHQKKRR
jgi:transposase